jgi:outer membrane protein TolC
VNRDAEQAVWTRYDEVETGFKVLRNIETGLLPSARSAFNIERARFESGRGEVTLFLETFRGVLMAEMDRQRAIEEFAARWGALEQEVGGPVVLQGDKK